MHRSAGPCVLMGGLVWRGVMWKAAELTRLMQSPSVCRGPGQNRTADTRFRKPLLYPLSYGAVEV